MPVVTRAGEVLEAEVEVAAGHGEPPGRPVRAWCTGSERYEGRGYLVLRWAVARRVLFSFPAGPGRVAAGGFPAGVPDGPAVGSGDGNADGALPVFRYFVGQVA